MRLLASRRGLLQRAPLVSMGLSCRWSASHFKWQSHTNGFWAKWLREGGELIRSDPCCRLQPTLPGAVPWRSSAAIPSPSPRSLRGLGAAFRENQRETRGLLSAKDSHRCSRETPLPVGAGPATDPDSHPCQS